MVAAALEWYDTVDARENAKAVRLPGSISSVRGTMSKSAHLFDDERRHRKSLRGRKLITQAASTTAPVNVRANKSFLNSAYSVRKSYHCKPP